MNYTLHKLQEGFIATSDEEIKHKETWYNPMTADIGINWYEKGIPKEWSKTLKVIAQQYQIDFSALSEETQKEIGWFDVYKLALNETTDIDNSNFDRGVVYGFHKGFQKAQELLFDRKFTLEDMKNLMHNSIIFKEENQHLSLGEYAIKNKEWFDKYIQSLSQPKSWNIELEMEYDLESIDSSKKVMRPKLTNGKIKITKFL